MEWLTNSDSLWQDGQNLLMVLVIILIFKLFQVDKKLEKGLRKELKRLIRLASFSPYHCGNLPTLK
ncbi:hypothetical protein [Martelella mediterranea]|uniref:hypothetical protein n=1 Tax=Martelella mediterranea TaxID=293089 RepID=UPI001043C2A8|nr:hypothetical protein [Martelella mediterranea]